MSTWWVDDAGTRLRITPQGILVGRGSGCDVVVDHTHISRRQVLIRLDGDRPILEVLGRAPVEVDGVRVSGREARPLTDGVRVELPGCALSIVGDSGAGSAIAEPRCGIQRDDGRLFPVRHFPVVIGGSRNDDLVIAGWPSQALRLQLVQGGLVAESTCELRIGGRTLGADGIVAVTHGTSIEHGGESLRIIALGGQTLGTTVIEDETRQPSSVTLVRHPSSGGQVVLGFEDERVEIPLTERRFDCVYALVCPSAPTRPGDWIADEQLIAVVWPGKLKSRVDVNVLISRLRKDLVKAGVNGPALIERDRGSTRLVLRPGARVMTTDA